MCQKRKFSAYRMRLLYELQRSPKSIFVTLTFDEPSLSRFKDNPNRSLSLFLDRVRKKYGKQVRHWFVAEYGKKRGRLHYHGLLFNCQFDNEELETMWKYGNTFVGYANEITAKYIVKYLTKEDTKGKLPPRIITSKGIGDNWLQTLDCKLLQKSLSTAMTIGGYPVPIPRYYLDKMYNEREKEIISYYNYMESIPTFYLNGRAYTDEKLYNQALKFKCDMYENLGFIFDKPLKTTYRISREQRTKVLFEVVCCIDNMDFFKQRL